MKVVILAGGLGTRISEASNQIPKPMIQIGGKPIIWHIMKIYAFHGLKDFIICCGFQGYFIKEYFANYNIHNYDYCIDFAENDITLINKKKLDWKVTLVDTGEYTMTGGRLKRVREYLDNKDFCFTYGDGVGDINVEKLLHFHKEHGKLATITATKAPGRFGSLDLEGNSVKNFEEKPMGDSSWINGGFFVLSPKVIDYIDDDQTSWERKPIESLAAEGQLNAWLHNGFWHPMDTLRDKNYLQKLWDSGEPPWKIW